MQHRLFNIENSHKFLTILLTVADTAKVVEQFIYFQSNQKMRLNDSYQDIKETSQKNGPIMI
jgi:hypothetical protein